MTTTTPNTAPILPRLTYKWVEIGMTVLLAVLGVFLLWQSIELGPGWGPSGPQPGLWPFSLTVLLMLGTVGVFLFTLKNPDERPFFEATQEVVDLLSVGLPIVVSVFLIPWLGIFVTSAVYLAFFMYWYGQSRWYTAVTSSVVFAVILWLMLRKGFNLSMPMSVLYYENILPF